MHDTFYAIKLPAVKGAMLDRILEKGWYRYGSSIFTTNFLEHNEVRYGVHWIRYNVNASAFSKKQHALIRRNQKFDVQIDPFEYSEQLEQLHDLYVDHIDFVTGPSLESIMEEVDAQVFESYMIRIYDQNKLIAVGIFDLGFNSIAGIKNYFHPDYKKYSLGKYLVLLKKQFCEEKKIAWYYPGYIVPGYPKFDYKIMFDKSTTEIYEPQTDSWTPFTAKEKILYPGGYCL
jgi:arginine-tRNA-protein transferase